MKCNKCNAEWKVDPTRSASITVCPFCQEEIETNKSSGWKYFDNTKELLEYIAAEYGNDALFGRKYFSDHTAPMMPQGQKNLVKQAFDCDAVKVLQDNVNANQQDKEIAVKQAVKKLTDLMFSQEAAERVIWEFTNAIGWGMPEPQGGALPPENNKNVTPPSLISSTPPPPSDNIGKLMMLGWQSADVGDWNEAREYFTKARETDPSYSLAFLGLICIDLKCSQEDKLANIKDPTNITNHKYYKLVAADPSVKTRVDGYVKIIKDRIDAERKAVEAEAERKRKAAEEATRRKCVQDAFNNACKTINNAKIIDDFRKAIAALNNIDSYYQDINSQIKGKITECEKKIATIEAEQKAAVDEAERKRKAAEEATRRKHIQDAFDNAYKIMNAAQNPNDYQKAITAFGSIDSNYADINNQIKDNISECERLKKEAELKKAEQERKEQERIAKVTQRLAPIREQVVKFQSCISAGVRHTVGLKTDGTVVAVKLNEYGRNDTRDWHDIISVSAGFFHTVGLKVDGTVVATGSNRSYNSETKKFEYSGQCDTQDWKNIVAISTFENYTVGLKDDGTVVAVGLNNHGQCNIQDWRDIVAISAGFSHTVGLKTDGTVVATGENKFGQCDTQDWKDIIEISAGGAYTIGLKADGTVVAVGNNNAGQCDIKEWNDIVAISTGAAHTVGLKADGTVVSVGSNQHLEFFNTEVKSDNRNNTQNWRNVVAISAGCEHTVGLLKDGTVVAVGNNGYGQCWTEEWQNIGPLSKQKQILRKNDEQIKYSSEKLNEIRERIAKFQKYITSSGSHTVGLKKNGTVVAVGYNKSYEYGDEEHVYSGQLDTQGWNNIIAISASDDFTIGLKKNGTVVATGRNSKGQCNVQDWKNIVSIFTNSRNTFGLKNDGTVVHTVWESYSKDFDTKNWRDIVEVSVNYSNAVGLKSDGTVVVTGSDYDGQCNTKNWRDIVAIATGYHYTVGLKRDGTVIAVGKNDDGQCNTNDWRDIVAIATGESHTVGLKADGTVVAVGDNKMGGCSTQYLYNVVAIYAEGSNTIALKADGTVIELVDAYKESNIQEWRDIVAVFKGSSLRCTVTVGLKADGTVVACGSYSEEIQKWYDISPIACRYCGGEISGMFTKKCKSCGKSN